MLAARAAISAGVYCRNAVLYLDTVLGYSVCVQCFPMPASHTHMVAQVCAAGPGLLQKLGRVLKEKAQGDLDRVFKGTSKTRQKLGVKKSVLLGHLLCHLRVIHCHTVTYIRSGMLL